MSDQHLDEPCGDNIAALVAFVICLCVLPFLLLLSAVEPTVAPADSPSAPLTVVAP